MRGGLSCIRLLVSQGVLATHLKLNNVNIVRRPKNDKEILLFQGGLSYKAAGVLKFPCHSLKDESCKHCKKAIKY